MLGTAIQPYNLNLELIYADGTELPITIDPDIRNPGGDPGKVGVCAWPFAANPCRTAR